MCSAEVRRTLLIDVTLKRFLSNRSLSDVPREITASVTMATTTSGISKVCMYNKLRNLVKSCPFLSSARLFIEKNCTKYTMRQPPGSTGCQRSPFVCTLNAPG